jgi:hypothetical protein
VGDLFRQMFPDFSIGQQFSMERDKVSYYVAFVLSPFFKTGLLAQLVSYDQFLIRFDESLNQVIQKEQVDFFLRFWDTLSQEVSTLFLQSSFIEHTRVEDLLEEFERCVGQLDFSKNCADLDERSEWKLETASHSVAEVGQRVLCMFGVAGYWKLRTTCCPWIVFSWPY